MKNEAVGFLKIGLAASEVLAGLGEPTDKSPSRIWGADGLEHQKWAESPATSRLSSNAVIRKIAGPSFS